MQHRHLLALFSLLLFALAGCADGAGGPDAPAGDLIAELDLGDLTDVAVDDDRGEVAIHVVDGDVVTVYADIHGGEESDQDDVAINVEESGGALAIDAVVAAEDVEADLDVRVPAGVHLQVDTLGDVLVTGHHGDAEIQAIDGDVEVQVPDLEAGVTLTIEADDGAVRIGLPADGAGAQVTAASTGGSVLFEGLVFDGVNAAGAASGTVGDAGAVITVEASGDVVFEAL